LVNLNLFDSSRYKVHALIFETNSRLREPAKLLSLTSKARQTGRKQKRRQGTSTANSGFSSDGAYTAPKLHGRPLARSSPPRRAPTRLRPGTSVPPPPAAAPVRTACSRGPAPLRIRARGAALPKQMPGHRRPHLRSRFSFAASARVSQFFCLCNLMALEC